MLFVIPFSRSFKLKNLEESRDKAVFMGVGDVVIPNILVVSAQVFTDSPSVAFIKVSALLTLVGGIIGLFLLIYTVERKEGAHPGLPFLNTGVIAGYLSYLILFGRFI
jgi:presenilin-like A22 family membrane protease